MMPRPRRLFTSGITATAPALLAAALLFVVAACPAGTAAGAEMRATLLTRDLGDPANPGNAKVAVVMPPSLLGSSASASPDDFRVYIHPPGLSPAEGGTERYRARGLYLWRVGGTVFLDARTIPGRDGEGEAVARIVYAPDGTPAAEALAEGRARFTSDNVDVALAVDISLSMNYNDPQKRRVAGARTFIDMAMKGGGVGRVALITFNHNAALNVPLTPLEEGKTVLDALNRIATDGLTNLDNPVSMALDVLRGARNPAIILLSDGKNEGHVYEGAHARAVREGVRIFSVGLSEQADHALLRAMADATGGIYFRAVKDSDLPEIYARVAAELGKRQLLHAETLRSPRGEITLPIDGTVKRLVAMADAGVSVGLNGPGGGMVSGGAMNSVHMGSPERGDWNFAWDRAEPGKSTLGLFGDTQFFLDVFPPQLRRDYLAVGATLAHGGRALTGGRVWIEPVPGVIDRRLPLHDDGQHGDGAADDGVYGATLRLPRAPDRIDLILRAAGDAWDEGGFVRQTSDLALQTGGEPPGRATLGGDVDFGVLFPGETGSAVARVEFEAESPRDLAMRLDWLNGASDWPEMSSAVRVSPGSRSFELEMTVPEDSLPGEYTGRFSIGDGGETEDSATARVRVGDVRFGGAEAIDLGVVPPGTFVSRAVRVDYDADKAAPLSVAAAGGGGDFSVSGAPGGVSAGSGGIDVEVVVSVPLGKAEGDYTGTLVLRAGPGRADIPVRWAVRPYAAQAVAITPVPGLPAPPELTPEAAPLRQTPELSSDFWQPGLPSHESDPLASPWEKTQNLFREPSRVPDATASPGDVIPAIPAPRAGGSGFWSAWWLYILAALLLLLLLLLLLAYILYRLQKSALARFLLASALANIILLVAFILLLSSASAVTEPIVRDISVNLIGGGMAEEFLLTPAEQEMLGAASADSAASGGGGPAVAEVTFAGDAAPSGGGELAREKSAGDPGAEERDIALAEVRQAAAVELEQPNVRSLSRRERPSGRSQSEPQRDLPEMPDPDADAAGRRGKSTAAVEEARLDFAAAEDAERPVWSESDRRPVQPATGDEDMLLAAAGMEAVSLDTTLRRADPRGMRRSAREIAVDAPEPRVDIDDPVRDAGRPSLPDAAERREDPGVQELRADVSASGPDAFGEKPGAVPTMGAVDLAGDASAVEPHDEDGGQAVVGGPRAGARGSPRGDDSAMPDNGGAMPGGTTTAAAEARNRTDGRGTGRSVGEERFDDGPAGASDGLNEHLESNGGGRGAADGTTPGDAPGRLQGDGGADGTDRIAFQHPAGQDNGASGLRSRERRDGNGGGAPERGDAVPGNARSGAPADGADTGETSRGRARDARAGEGRFDDMTGVGDNGGDRERLEVAGGRPASSFLDDVFDNNGLGALPLQTASMEWQRNDRRRPRRSVNMAASSVDIDSLLIVVGDFARVPDAAAKNLFGVLAGDLGRGLTVEERDLSPADANLADCLLAVLSPDEVRDWSDAAVRSVADYLRAGGHIWMDAARPALAKPFMDRLARASGGDFASLDADHQLADGEIVDALTLDGKLAAVVTYQDWRKDWRQRPGADRAMRFLKRTLNYFLSGNAETGISLEPDALRGGVLIEPGRQVIPELLAGGAARPGIVWDEFGPDTAQTWRMPSWSDPGRIAAISDGEGGRALKMELGAAAKGRTAVYRTLTPRQDFSTVDHITLDAYYDGDGEAGLSMVFTIDGPDGWSDYESRALPLLKGWNRLRFNLGERTFRPLSGDAEDAALPDASRTGRAGFFLYREAPSPGVSLFRDIRLHTQ